MNSFGNIFRISIYGESHGKSVGVLIDGCPAGIAIEDGDFLKDLSRRKSGQPGTTPRRESDQPHIASGVYKGLTTGAPILISFDNEDADSAGYSEYSKIPRPGHADFTAMRKYSGYNDMRGSGHFSGRLTVGLVAAGTIAKKIISPIDINAELISAGGEKDVQKAVENALKAGDSIGGLIECTIDSLPVVLGEPFFNSVESVISHLIFSIPAIKAIEFGSGFASASARGSQYNDPIIDLHGKTATNNAGGINGGISNGNPIVFRVAVKPPSSIPQPQRSINLETGKQETFTLSGRHDACIALRMPPIIEAAAAVAIADLKLTDQAINGQRRQ